MSITLVHGTWSRDAPWVQESGGTFRGIRGALTSYCKRNLLPVPHVVHHKFVWSGRNTFDARLAASRDLNDFLQRLVDASPDAKHVLIAHSHGGSVVAYCLKENPELAGKLAGVVFLATPFVAARVRSDAEWLVKSTALLLTMLCLTLPLIGLLYWGWLDQGTLISHADSQLATRYFLILTVLPVLVGLLLFSWWRRAVPREIARSQRLHEFAYRISTADLPACNALLARVTGDEASTVLAMSQFGTWLSWKVGSIITRPIAWVAEPIQTMISEVLRPQANLAQTFFLRAGAVGLLVWAATFLFYGTYQILVALRHSYWLGMPMEIWEVVPFYISQAWFYGVSAVDYMSLVTAVLFWYAVAVFVAVATLLVIVSMLSMSSFGRWFFWSVLLDVSVEAVPLGKWATIHRPWRTGEGHESLFSLSHSEPYDNRDVIEEIGAWIALSDNR